MNITNLYQLKPIFSIQFFIVFNRPFGNHPAVIPPISRSHVAPYGSIGTGSVKPVVFHDSYDVYIGSL